MAAVHQTDRTGPKVLIIDDDPVARMMLRQLLSRIATVEIIEATNGLDGIIKAKEKKPDLCFLDVQMPVKDGLETLRELREDPELGDVSVIVLSVSTDSVKARRMMEFGVLDRIAKPMSYDMVKRLRRLVESLGIH